MNNRPQYRLAGALLIIVPVVFTICFTILQVQFEYPDILRQPTAEVLAKFQSGGAGLVATWYTLTITAVLMIPLVLLLHAALAEKDGASTILRVASVFGVIAGLTQTLGFLRWPFLVPYLAQVYLDPGASEARRAAAELVFEGFHRYAGMAVGEHLGYLSTSIWTFLIALLLLRSQIIGRGLGVVGMTLAIGIAAGLLEPAGLELAGTVNALSYLAWALWLVLIGIVLLTRRISQQNLPASLAVR